MLVTPKPNGRLRVCMDPRYLNEYLVRAVHPFPDIDQVFSSIKGAKFFSKIDLTHGFWNLRLDEASSNLCVFASPWGRFRYKRLPFGVSPAPEVFHRVVADVIKGLPNVIHYIDDILIFAATREQHDALVREVIRRLRQVGFAICQDKCSFNQTAVTFLGHKITGDRIFPDPMKLEALQCMQPPGNSAELHSFLGFVNYLARYVPNLAALAEPLRRLQTSKVHFEWTSEQDLAFRQIRELLISSPGLVPFDPNLPLVIATDASQHGLGGVLLQNERPVLYVARSLTPAESRYAIIEKELLAVVFVLTRCHFYTYGRPVIVRTDHKPLLGLVNSDVEKLSLRLRRFLEKLFPYALQWEYLPGRENHFPDALSRMGFKAPLRVDELRAERAVEFTDRLFETQLAAGGPLFQAIAEAGKQDLQFQALMKCAAHGWPPKLLKRDARRYLLQPYWSVRHELRLLGPYLLWGDRVCVPRPLHGRALALLHQGHPGVTYMQQRAKNIFYWPGVTADIYRYVTNCESCTAHQNLPPREPLLQEPPASYPGECIAADFFDLGSETFLVACDIFSNFPFYARVQSPSATALLNAVRSIFLQSGFPRVFLSDGGPAFRAEPFQNFLRSGACQHRVSSPRYAQSNGAAERVVQTIKMLKKKVSTPDELFMAVLQLQNTPRPDTGVSPAQLFLGRSQRTPLFPAVRQFHSPWSAHVRVLHTRQAAQASYYNRHAHVRPSLCFYPGQRAYLRDPDTPSQIVEILGPAAQPRAYSIRLPSGHVSVRNQRFLFPLTSPGTITVPSPTSTPATMRPAPSTTNSTLAPGLRPTRQALPPSTVTNRSSLSHLPSTSTPAVSSSPSPSSSLIPAGLSRSSCPRMPVPVTPTGRGHGPAPPPRTTSTSSSGRASSPSLLSPLADRYTSASGTPVPPANDVTGPANALGTSRSGRLVFPSLKARENVATGQARPDIILQPQLRANPLPSTLPTLARAPTTPPQPLRATASETTGSLSSIQPPVLPPPPAGPLAPAPPPSPGPPAATTAAISPALSCVTISGSVPAVWRTSAITHSSWTSNGLPRTKPHSSPSTYRVPTTTTMRPPRLVTIQTPRVPPDRHSCMSPFCI